MVGSMYQVPLTRYPYPGSGLLDGCGEQVAAG